MRIIFFGTPEFATAILKMMVENGYRPLAVVTAPDRPSGRGLKMKSSSVKDYAEHVGLKVLQPIRLKDPEFLAQIHQLNPDLQFVVAFRMLPKEVWEIPAKGTWNLHASLLPQYRGAAPINHAIINGEHETGLTTFKIKHEIDTGEIAMRKSMTIGENETAGELHDRMMVVGANLVLDTIKAIEYGNIQLESQEGVDESNLRLAPKLNAAFCKIDPSRSNQEVHNLIRGLSPFPGASGELVNGDDHFPLKIFRSKISSMVADDRNPGDLISDGKSYIHMACGRGMIEIHELQVAGKKRLHVADFLRGFPLSNRAKFI